MAATGGVFAPHGQIGTGRSLIARTRLLVPSLVEGVRANMPFALWATSLLVAAAAFALRAFNLAHAFDVYSDEVVYSQVSAAVAHTLTLNYQGFPAFTHPPLLFILEGAYFKLFVHTTNPVQLVLDSRYFNVLLSAVSASLMFLVARRVAGWWAGVAAALIFALDPFVISISSRNLLQPSALFWVLLGYSVLFTAPRGTLLGWRVLVTGLAFGAALLTEEETAFHTLLPMAVCFALNWSIPRRAAVVICTIPCLMYAVLVASVAAVGQWSYFSQTKLDGVGRLFGVLHVSGFGTVSPDRQAPPVSAGQAVSPNSPTAAEAASPSFVHAVLADLGQYATTYVMIGLGVVAIVFLLLRTDPLARLLTVWCVCAYVLQAYSVKFGTNEAQYYYYVAAPALLADVTAAAIVIRSGSHIQGNAAVDDGDRLAVLHPLLCLVRLQLGRSAYHGRQRFPAAVRLYPGECAAGQSHRGDESAGDQAPVRPRLSGWLLGHGLGSRTAPRPIRHSQHNPHFQRLRRGHAGALRLAGSARKATLCHEGSDLRDPGALPSAAIRHGRDLVRRRRALRARATSELASRETAR